MTSKFANCNSHYQRQKCPKNPPKSSPEFSKLGSIWCPNLCRQNLRRVDVAQLLTATSTEDAAVQQLRSACEEKLWRVSFSMFDFCWFIKPMNI